MSSEYGYFDGPDERVLEVEEEEILREDDLESPDVWWREDIQRIENPEFKEKAIERASRLLEKERQLDEKLESGKIDQITYEGKRLVELDPKMSRAAREAALFSVDLTWDKLGDLSEDYDLLVRGDLETLEQNGQNKERISEAGVEKSQEIADRLLEEGEIDEEGHKSVSRLIRNQK